VQKDKPPIQVFKAFDTRCSSKSTPHFTLLETGNINITWLVFCGIDGLHPDEPDFVLQKINSHVFVEPKNIAEQIHGVSSFLESKSPGFVPKAVAGVTGLPWVVDDAGGVWKMARFVHNTLVLNKIRSAHQASAIAEGYGRFQYLLRDFELPIADSPVKGFHELALQLEAFHYLALSSGRALEAEQLIRQASRLVQDWLPSIGVDLMQGEKKAVIHGDCKVSNILLSPDGGRACAVVDLDTVMYGERGWDFGDLVRSGANALGEEDDTAGYSHDIFKALASGFVRALQDVLQVHEKEQLVASCQYMTFMIALRFLVDYLNGDEYFRVNDSEHNLRRARVQFALFEQMRSFEADMLRHVRSI